MSQTSQTDGCATRRVAPWKQACDLVRKEGVVYRKGGVRVSAVKVTRWMASLALAGIVCLAALTSATPSRIVIRGGRLFDSNNGVMLSERTIVIEGKRILAVGTSHQPPRTRVGMCRGYDGEHRALYRRHGCRPPAR